uniref:hypothetical protein n=1 Tax=Vibrio sp. Vb0592 TaxID=2816072 RepID=UPI001A9056F2
DLAMLLFPLCSGSIYIHVEKRLLVFFGQSQWIKSEVIIKKIGYVGHFATFFFLWEKESKSQGYYGMPNGQSSKTLTC